ncbi:MAG: hypothetical protein JW880_03420, partial [Candidatus Thermoplasmatota archaeon]|nr:hypothetical protein [Candidatus Thermoplasmatota archaeon]
MSEETNSSVPSSETAQPEPAPEPSVSAPPKGGKKKLWVVIAAVAVVALLIGSAVWIMFLAPIKVSMEPADAELSVDAGKVLKVSVKVKKGINDVTDDAKYLWTVLPNNLGSWQKRAEASVNLTAGKAAGSGDVICKVTYKGEEVEVTKTLTVNPPYLDQVLVSPPIKTLEKGKTQVFTASAVDSVADPISGLTYTWSVSGDVSAEIDSTTGTSVLFTAGPTYGNVTLTATATSAGVTKSGIAAITIGPLPPRSVDYSWYDMFNVPFDEWWDKRAVIGKEEIPLSHEYPYLFKWVGFPEGNTYIYTNMRLNITGRNMSEINMNERPEFLPLHGNARGGTAVIDWYLQYLTSDEMKRFPDATSAWGDGWVVSLNGTVTLDEQAALSTLLGLTAEGFDSFDSWWTLHKGEIKTDFGDWFKTEAGKDRLDIFPAYDYAFTTLAWDIDAEKVGDNIVLTYDLVTWGGEMLLSMWMREAFMPTEWYFEDMDFHATIGPEWTTLDVDTAIAYAVYAYEATNIPGEPCWVWEALVQDYVVAGPPENRESLYNKYANQTYLNTAPGSAWYGKNMTYDYVPGAWNLSENETLKLAWPSDEQTFVVHVSSGVTANHTDYMIVNFSEPMMSDAEDLLPGSVVIDNDACEMVFTGPIDMWHWSQETTNPEHSWLTSEWDRMNLFPYGAPYIEFNPAAFGKSPDQLVLSATESWEDWDDPMVVAGETVDLKVTILDQFGGVYIPYEGTVEFSTNGTGVTLPSDYTFTVGDAGVAVVSGLSFSTAGWYTITVSDTDPGSEVKSGSLVNIYVVEDPPVIDHFTIEVPGLDGLVLPGMPNDVHVWAHNQYGDRVFKKYDGTVTFSTNATLGTYTLPGDYTFAGAASEGYAVIPGLVFDEQGMYSLTVSDTVVTTATGTTDVVVEIVPTVQYRLYDMFEEPWGEWWPYRLISWKTDIILSNESHAYTMVYNPDMIGRHGIIMAPYRWNVTATNMSTISVNDPAVMPVFGPEVEGASVYLDLYWQYINKQWWNDYILPTWSSNSNWSAGLEDLINVMEGDGYYIFTVYTARMNREAAETWLNMPQAADPLTWWAAN